MRSVKGTVLNNVTLKETKIQILKNNSNICVNGGERHQMAGLSGLLDCGVKTASLTSSVIHALKLALFFTDFTLSDELEKGLLFHIIFIRNLGF